mmetsp:Transcript_15456/g.41743  ORF Transcript_15456/g.41743 Transcript_15456/m.41743 type:complete len:335 (+) Transcript_15456:466-1470(+)
MCSTLVPEASASSLQAVTRRSGGLVVCGSRVRPRSPSRMSVVSSREGGGGKCVACGIHAGSRPSVLPQSARDNDRRTAASNPGTCGDAGGVRPWVWHGVNKSLPSCEKLHCIALVCVGRRQHVLEDRLHGDVGHADHHGDKDGRPEAEEAVLELANTADARELPLGHCIVAESVYSDVRTGALQTFRAIPSAASAEESEAATWRNAHTTTHTRPRFALQSLGRMRLLLHTPILLSGTLLSICSSAAGASPRMLTRVSAAPAIYEGTAGTSSFHRTRSRSDGNRGQCVRDAAGTERLEQPLVADDAVDDDLHALALHLRAQADQRRPGLRHVAPG